MKNIFGKYKDNNYNTTLFLCPFNFSLIIWHIQWFLFREIKWFWFSKVVPHFQQISRCFRLKCFWLKYSKTLRKKKWKNHSKHHQWDLAKRKINCHFYVLVYNSYFSFSFFIFILYTRVQKFILNFFLRMSQSMSLNFPKARTALFVSLAAWLVHVQTDRLRGRQIDR